MKKYLALLIGVVNGMQLLASEEDFARAFTRWQQRPCLVSALHVLTSGLFLAEDLTALG